MNTSKIIFSLFIGVVMLTAQVGSVLAAPARQEGGQVGEVVSLTCGTNGTTVILAYFDETPEYKEVEISMATAVTLGLIEDENIVCNAGETIDSIINSIDPAEVVPVEEENRHPVGTVLASFFDFVNYDDIMEAHENGTGFGVIAQALWMTSKLDSDPNTFITILQAKKDGNYNALSAFFDGDDVTPTNWGQFKKALLDKKNNLGAVMSDKDNKEDKTNKDKSNNGKGQDKDKNKN